MKLFFVRLLNMLIGLFLYAFGIIITIKANIGYAPWEIFHVGLSNTTGLSIGMISILAGLIIVIFITISGEKLGLGTISNMLFIGLFIDIILMIDFIPIAHNIISGIVMIIIGLFIISIATFFYMKSAFGAGPRDNLMVVLTRKTKMPVGICRGLIELLVTVVGWLLGGMVGIGTVISVIAIGFCIQITFRVLKFDVTSVKHESMGDTFAVFSGRRKSEQIIPPKV